MVTAKPKAKVKPRKRKNARVGPGPPPATSTALVVYAPPPKPDRPLHYREDLAERICILTASIGRGLDWICSRHDDLPNADTVVRWLDTHPDFEQRYARAKARQADILVDEALEICADSSGDVKVVVTKTGRLVTVLDTEFVGRARLRVDTLLKVARLLNPKKFSEAANAAPGTTVIETVNVYKGADPLEAAESYRQMIEGG